MQSEIDERKKIEAAAWSRVQNQLFKLKHMDKTLHTVGTQYQKQKIIPKKVGSTQTDEIKKRKLRFQMIEVDIPVIVKKEFKNKNT